MKTYRLSEELGNIDESFLEEVFEYKIRERRITMSVKKIAAVAACVVVVIGAVMAAVNIRNIFGTEAQIQKADMTDSIVIVSLSLENNSPELNIDVLDPTMLPFGEDEVILAVLGEFDISDSDGNFIAHINILNLNVFPYDPNVYGYHLGGIDDEPKEGYVALNETVTRLTVLRAEQEDGSWYEEAKIFFDNCYYNREDGEYYALSYDVITLESGTYNVHINSIEIAYSNGEKSVELAGDWTTTFTI